MVRSRNLHKHRGKGVGLTANHTPGLTWTSLMRLRRTRAINSSL